MKVLVDTSVWSLALRRKEEASLDPEERRLKAQLTEAIQDGRVAIIGIIRQEILSGIKNDAQFEKLRTELEPFHDEALETADFVHAARLYNACRAQGIEAGTIDVLICAVAALRDWHVLSNDRGLSRCLDVAGKFAHKPSKSVASGPHKAR